MTHHLFVRLPSLPKSVRLLAANEPWPTTLAPAESKAEPPSASTATSTPAPLATPTATEELARLADNLARALDQFDRQLASKREVWRQAAVELGMLIAAHILKHAVESGTFPWSDSIAEMTAALNGSVTEVRLHPADLDLWRRAQPEPPLPRGVRLVGDDELRRGECLVASDTEVQFHSLADRLRTARETLLREWERDSF